MVYKIELRGDELHTKLGGGIPKNSLMLIEGKNGMGKSVLSQRFIYGLIKNNQTVTYISTELTVSSFMNQMESLSYDIKEAFLKQDLKFISLFPAIAEVHFKKNLIEELLEAEEIFNSEVIVLDTLGEFILQEGLTLKEIYQLVSFFNKLTSQGKTVIISMDPDAIDHHILQTFKKVSNVYILLETKEQYGNILNLIRIVRYSGARDDVEKDMAFKVRAGIGIVLELAS